MQQHQLQSTIQALMALNSSPKVQEPNVKDPDPFSGLSQEKLPSFLAQCQIVFKTQPLRYASDASKVMFAGSHLTDIAYEWFHPQLSIPDNPILTSFPAFSQALESMFGDPDIVATAERKLRKLRMGENSQISRYLIDFSKFSTPLPWNDEVLCSQFYLGLPDRIKDQIALKGKPKTLQEMKDLAQVIDSRYWERHFEKIPASTSQTPNLTPLATSSSSNRRFHSSHQNSKPHHSSSPSSNRPNPSQASQQASSSNVTKNHPKPVSPLIKVLGPDGKLLPSERERRLQAGCCLYCGKADHQTSSCPKRPLPSSSSSPKAPQAAPKPARAAKATSHSGKEEATQ